MKKMYVIYDSKAETYTPPFLFKNNGEAIRALTETANTNDTTLGKNPEDFHLIEKGTFNESTGVIELIAPQKTVINIIELVKTS